MALSTLFIFVPLLLTSKQNKAKIKRIHVTNANVVKQRISELDREVEEGLISEKDKLSAVKELKLALVEETERLQGVRIHKDALDAIESASENASKATQDANKKSAINWPMLGLLAIPALVVGVWVYLNANQLDGLQEYLAAQEDAAELTRKITGQAGLGAGVEVTPNDYAKFALVIRKRLRESPEDIEGWRLLGQVQMAIGRMEESVAAFEKALDIEPRNLGLREKYAQALMAQGTEDSLENAKRQVTYLVNLEPDNRDYRLLLTVVATQLGDTELALNNFVMIRDQLSPQSSFYQSLVSQLISIGVPENLILQGNNTQSLASEIAASENTIEEKDSQLSAQSEDAPTQLVLNIDLDKSLQSKLPASGYLIVFAQNADNQSRVPLAVNRTSLSAFSSQFPLQVMLSDEDAMMPGVTLSSANNVKITARISADADVMPSSGELQGEISQLAIEQGKLSEHRLLINKEL